LRSVSDCLLPVGTCLSGTTHARTHAADVEPGSPPLLAGSGAGPGSSAEEPPPGQQQQQEQQEGAASAEAAAEAAAAAAGASPKAAAAEPPAAATAAAGAEPDAPGADTRALGSGPPPAPAAPLPPPPEPRSQHFERQLQQLAAHEGLVSALTAQDLDDADALACLCGAKARWAFRLQAGAGAAACAPPPPPTRVGSIDQAPVQHPPLHLHRFRASLPALRRCASVLCPGARGRRPASQGWGPSRAGPTPAACPWR
jgi:hypothetical protein